MKKHRLMTHTDLDGVGCAVVMKYYDEDVEVVFCSNKSITHKLEDLLKSEHLKEYSKLTITDLPISLEMAEKLDQLKDIEVRLIDHHETQLELNQYEWADVIVEEGDQGECAANLLKKHFQKQEKSELSAIHKEFVEYVRLYDTWEWEKKECFLARELNHLLGFQGLERFFEKMVTKLPKGILITDEERDILQILEENQGRYIKRKAKQIIPVEANGYKIGLVFGEQYISEVGHALAEVHQDLDLIGICTGERISLRTIKEEIHLGEWSKEHYGGGGHRGAAGMNVSEEKIKQIAKILFE